MKTSFLRGLAQFAVLGIALCGSGMASAGVTVTFVQSERYADMPFSPWDRETVMKDFDQYLVKLGQKWLPAGQDLKIEVLDIDLAGRLKRNTGHEVRVLTGGADWPMMEIRYTLESGGKVLRTGTDRVADMNYFQSHIKNHAKSRESLYYEKLMLQDWFKAKFAAAP